ELARIEALAAGEDAAAGVELLALVRVADDVVGRLDLLEALLGRVVVRVAVGVVLAGELAVGPLDLVLRGLLVHPEGLVWVLHSATTTRAVLSTTSPALYPFSTTSRTTPDWPLSPGRVESASW